MIRRINSKEYVRFLRSNNAEKKQVSINENGDHFGYFQNERLIGVISKLSTKNTIRIKGFLVNDVFAGNGVGTELLKYLIDDSKDMTCFATVYSKKLFEKYGFEVENEKANNIVFMKRSKKVKTPKFQLSDNIVEKLKPGLSEIGKVLLFLESEERKEALKYINKELKKLK